ncbi:MAG: flagellar hook-associated protein FlgL [Desulfovibrionaceae bacterium]
MRITNAMMSQIRSQGVNRAGNKLLEVLEQGNSGVKVNRPSDNPIAYALARMYDKQLLDNSRYLENNIVAKSWLDRQDVTLKNTLEITGKIYTLAEEAANGTLGGDELNAIAYELRSLYKNLSDISSNQFNGNYLYSGKDFHTPPYVMGTAVDSTISVPVGESISFSGDTDKTITTRVPVGSGGEVGTDALTFEYSSDGGVTWQSVSMAADQTELDLGSGQKISFPVGTILAENDTLRIRPSLEYTAGTGNFDIEIMSGHTITVNGNGLSIFGGKVPSGKTPPDTQNMLEVVGKLIGAVESHDKKEISALLSSIKSSNDHIIDYQAKIGGDLNRLSTAQKLVESSSNVAKDSLSNVQDVDATVLLEDKSNLEIQYKINIALYSTIQKMNMIHYL